MRTSDEEVTEHCQRQRSERGRDRGQADLLMGKAQTLLRHTRSLPRLGNRVKFLGPVVPTCKFTCVVNELDTIVERGDRLTSRWICPPRQFSGVCAGSHKAAATTHEPGES